MIKIKEFGQESLSIRRSFISNTLNDSVKNEPTLSVFTKGIFWSVFKKSIGLEKNAEFAAKFCI